MELVLRHGSIDSQSQELIMVWTDLFDATESAKFIVRKVDDGFEMELVGGMNTVMGMGPGRTFYLKRVK